MKQIAREALKNMMDRKTDFILIDARGHEAFEREHIPGALSIPSNHLGMQVLKDLSKESLYITYCSGFECEASTIAARKLQKFGFKNVLQYKSGLRDLKEAGHPTEK